MSLPSISGPRCRRLGAVSCDLRLRSRRSRAPGEALVRDLTQASLVVVGSRLRGGLSCPRGVFPRVYYGGFTVVTVINDVPY